MFKGILAELPVGPAFLQEIWGLTDVCFLAVHEIRVRVAEGIDVFLTRPTIKCLAGDLGPRVTSQVFLMRYLFLDEPVWLYIILSQWDAVVVVGTLTTVVEHAGLDA